jgi:hypothetical protein
MMLAGRLRSDEPEALALRMEKHFGHKVRVERRDNVTRIETRFGTIELEPAPGALLVRLQGDELERLREVTSDHLRRFARGAPAGIVWESG